MDLITCDEMAAILTRVVNAGFGCPVADHDGGKSGFTVAAPSTGQLFTVTVTDALTKHEA